MIGIVGGTGDFGRGLTKRLLHANYSVFIGSRSKEKGQRIAGEIAKEMGSSQVNGGSNEEAAKLEFVFITLPAASVIATVSALKPLLANKIVVETCVNLRFGKFIKAVEDKDGKSTYEIIREILDQSKVASALKTISAHKLLDLNIKLQDSDFVMSTSDEAYRFVEQIDERLGVKSFRVRGKFHAMTLERMTALAIQLNKEYNNSHFGYQVTQ